MKLCRNKNLCQCIWIEGRLGVLLLFKSFLWLCKIIYRLIQADVSLQWKQVCFFQDIDLSDIPGKETQLTSVTSLLSSVASCSSFTKTTWSELQTFTSSLSSEFNPFLLTFSCFCFHLFKAHKSSLVIL